MSNFNVRLGSALLAASALALCTNVSMADEGTSKADKYFAKAAQYEAQGDFEKAEKYRAKGEKYSGAEEYASQAEKYAAKATRYAEAGELEKAQKYAAKALKYSMAEGNSKAAKYAAKAERYALQGDLEKAANYAAKAEKYARKYNDSCWPEVAAEFDTAGYNVEVSSSKDLSNVVLLFADGTTQRYEGLDGLSQTFAGSAGHAGKVLTGVWIKSGCNHSGDGPGYGEFVEATQQTTGLPVVSISGSPVTFEGSEGTFGEASFTIALSEMVPLDGAPVSVSLRTVDGTAIAGEDFVPEEVVLTFLPGEVSLQYSVLIVGDHVREMNEESYAVELSDPVNALLGQSLAEGVIVDGDF